MKMKRGTFVVTGAIGRGGPLKIGETFAMDVPVYNWLERTWQAVRRLYVLIRWHL